MDARELTRDEKKKIRSLVTGMCANYDRETGLCLPLDCACYMLHKCWTRAYCRYFREAVLPLAPELLAALTVEGSSPELRACAVCGKAFLPEAQIFDCVRQHPEKLSQIRQFLNYYLPTTIKLMEQYVTLQNQNVKTENITAGMQKIEDLLDKVIVAFQRQLDALFESDVVDITADIRVMEQMMASEGLTNKKDFA